MGSEEFICNEEAQKILDLKSGDKIGNIMSDMTICPVGNATCQDYMELEIYSFNPDIGSEKSIVIICPLGVEGDGEKCPLNK